MTEVVLGVDLGAGSLRTGAVTANGRLAATSAAPIAIAAPHPGWSVVDPEVWWRTLATTVARHNDPHAAALVFGTGVPIVMAGLHVTHQAIGTPQRVARLAAVGTPVARAVCGMLSRPRPGGIERFGGPGQPLHDPCVIAYLLWPELFGGRDCHVTIETASETTLGRSTIDWWGSERERPNGHVVDRLDADEFYRRLTQSLAKLR